MRTFGANEYQANPQYPQWLYAESPAGADAAKDFLLGIDAAGNVVACAHKLRLPWRFDGRLVDVPALHNIMATPEHRKGIGGMLILSAIARDAHVLVAGSTDPLSLAYRKLGSQPIEGRWYRWMLNPASAAVHVLGSRAGLAPARWPAVREAQLRRIVPGLRVETSPSASRCGAIASAIDGAPDDAARPAWTADLVAWRFFHPIGPRHVLFSDPAERFVALVALGRRHGARVGRIVELRAADARAMRGGLRRVRLALLLLGGDFMLAFSADARQSELLDAIAAPRARGPRVDTWVYHRRRGSTFARYRFQGGAGDLGFEAIG